MRAGSLPNGRSFQDVRELKRLLLKDERQIARNLTTQLIVFATGAPVQFGDRPKVRAILDRAATKSYGVKTLIQLTIESELFRNKYTQRLEDLICPADYRLCFTRKIYAITITKRFRATDERY